MTSWDLTTIAQITGLALAAITSLAVVTGVAYILAINIQKLRIKLHDLSHESLTARTASQAAKNRQQEASNKARVEELQAKQRIAEAEGNLARFTLSQTAEMSTLKADANARSKGVLSQLDQRLNALLEQQREAEDRHIREKDTLQLQLVTYQDRVEDARRVIDDANAREQQHLATNARLEQEVRSLQDMIADLRAHLTAAETTKPLNASLMAMTKSIDDIAKKMATIDSAKTMP